jgi:hypothetical protein
MNRLVALLALTALCGFLPAGGAVRGEDIEAEPIRYSRTTPDNVVSRLESRIAAGEAVLEYEAEFGWLRSLLKELDVPESSQTLVFSKTSMQRERITPKTPRSMYFNDDVYVGYCRRGPVMELAAADPRLGMVFYTLAQEPGEKPVFIRQTDNCLLCHGSSSTQGVPGLVVRSVYVDGGGMPILSAGSYRTDHTSPLSERWGGWYVTGTHGSQAHLGNLVIKGKEVREPVDNSGGQNVTDLGPRFPTESCLTPHSDIVALMVLEHQAMVHNLMSQASFGARQALYYEESLNREMGMPPDHAWDSTERRIESVVEPLVRALLFCEEAPLTAPIRGTSGFAEEFAARGRGDGDNINLREMDLERRLFKTPLSYLIGSSAFAALPQEVRYRVLARIWEVVEGTERSAGFEHLSPADRARIGEAVVQHVSDRPAHWGR